MPRRVKDRWVHMPYEHPLFSSMDPERDRIAHMAILPRLSALIWDRDPPDELSFTTFDFEGKEYIVRGRSGRPERMWLWTRRIGDAHNH